MLLQLSVNDYHGGLRLGEHGGLRLGKHGNKLAEQHGEQRLLATVAGEIVRKAEVIY